MKKGSHVSLDCEKFVMDPNKSLLVEMYDMKKINKILNDYQINNIKIKENEGILSLMDLTRVKHVNLTYNSNFLSDIKTYLNSSKIQELCLTKYCVNIDILPSSLTDLYFEGGCNGVYKNYNRFDKLKTFHSVSDRMEQITNNYILPQSLKEFYWNGSINANIFTKNFFPPNLTTLRFGDNF